jgi:hypothetical protein
VAKYYLQDVHLYAGGLDLTGYSNKVDLAGEFEEKDTTNFGSAGWKENILGLGSAKASGEGQWDAGSAGLPDDGLQALLGSASAWTATPTSAAVGSLAYLTKMSEAKYMLGGSVGDVAPWQVDWSGTWPLVRGQLIHSASTARTATGNGTSAQLGALLSTQALYVCLHVISVSGTASPTLTVSIESDDATGFPSATTRGTFTAATAISGQVLKISGAVTDDWWRAKYTISGTNPSFLFCVSAGIGPA